MWCGLAALAAYGGALATLVTGYSHALDAACPARAPAPALFWPLLLAAVVLAVVCFNGRPHRRDPDGNRSGVDAFALFVVVAVPVAAIVTVFAFAVAYACWE
jgi:hypothetical protein